MQRKTMKRQRPCEVFLSVIAGVSIGGFTYAGNIDPSLSGARYAWTENSGWLNFGPESADVIVDDAGLVGSVWGENLGWVSLSCQSTNTCGQVSFGIVNDGLGTLSGFAWAENGGWISFSCSNTNTCGPNPYGVTIDPSTGEFGGQAYGENIGWMNFDASTNNPSVQTSWRPLDSDSDAVPDALDNCTLIANPAQLDSDNDGYGNNCDADLNNSGLVTTADFAILRSVLNQSASASPAAAAADLNGSGLVTTADFAILRALLNTPPGPSGLQCAGTIPCPSP